MSHLTPQIQDLLRKYDRTLKEQRNSSADRQMDMVDEDTNGLGHAHWMITRLFTQGHFWSQRKIGRWLGFIQGTMWTNGLLGIKSLRDDCRDLYPDMEP